MADHINIWKLPFTEADAINFLQEHGVLPRQRLCKNGHEMTLYLNDSVVWRCNRRECRSKIGMRAGNWCNNSKLPFLTIVRFFYSWAHELTSKDWCDRELKVSSGTTVDWNNYMREICEMVLESKSLSSKKDNNEGDVCQEDNKTDECALPSSDADTKTTERKCESGEPRSKRPKGSARQHSESYFAELKWRSMIGQNDPFIEILNAVQAVWPPEVNM